MRVYELINMSDAYTFTAASPAVAACACLFVGEGMYAAEDRETGDKVCPILLDGGTCDAWFRETFDAEFEPFIAAHKAEIADALDSLVIGNRADFDAGLALCASEAQRDAWRTGWHERHRTSMNDIGGRGRRLAAALRSGADVVEPAPTAA